MNIVALRPSHWDWFLRRNPIAKMSNATGVACEDEDGVIWAVCILDNWTPNSVESHLCIDNPMCLRHGFLEEIARFVYHVSGRKMVMGIVPSNNKRALRLNAHIGFTEVARIPDGYEDGVDLVVLQLLKENCRWLNARTRKAA